MAKKKYFIFNHETLRYEHVKKSAKKRLGNVLGHVVVGVSLGTLFFFVLTFWLDSPETRMRDRQIEVLTAQNELQSRRVDEAIEALEQLIERDNNLFRVILQAEPIDRKYDPKYSRRYDLFKDMTNGELLKTNAQRIDVLTNLLYVQSKSYDELIDLFNRNEERLVCVPAIQPVANKDLKRTSSGFGNRKDPIFGNIRFHSGQDFSAKIGTPVYATGNAQVVSAGWDHGYGKCVVLSHGFNYHTLYAHLDDYKVKPGQKVKRGDIIASVGNTGKSTGPHLHYEVHYRRKAVNPQNYFFLELSPDEYARMAEIAANQGMALD